MPKTFIKCVKAVKKRITLGETPKYYYKKEKRYKTSPYAICRKATKYYGTTQEKRRRRKRKR